MRPGASAANGGTAGSQTMCALVAVALAVVLLIAGFTQLASPTMSLGGRRVGAATGSAKNWEGSYKTAGCDRGLCCCIAHLNAKASSFNMVILSGKLHGDCGEGVTNLAVRSARAHERSARGNGRPAAGNGTGAPRTTAHPPLTLARPGGGPGGTDAPARLARIPQTTQPLLDEGTVIEHSVVNTTVTYTLGGRTIRWTNNKVPECDGFAYPSEPPKLLKKVYAKRASPWVGQYVPKAGANRRSCCVPQKVTISHSHDMFGIVISLTKEGHGSRCFFRNDRTSVHQVSALAPQGNIISKMADGQPLRLVLNGENLLLDQPANEGCEGVSYVQTEKPSEDAADDGVITNEEADAIQDRS